MAKAVSKLASALTATGLLLAPAAAGHHKTPATRDMQDDRGSLPPWTPGYLYIHHISTGSGNAAYFIFPDGTTLLLDAGDLDRESMKANAPLKMLDPRPDASRRPGEWIVDYIRQFAPTDRPVRLDYAMISHFHSDHFGHVSAASPVSKTGAYRLTGILDVAESIPIGTLIDRAAPDYRAPVDLRRCPDGAGGTLANYLRYVDYRRGHGEAVEGLEPGRNDQLTLRYHARAYPGFSVRSLAASGVQWTGRGTGTVRRIPQGAITGCAFNENPFSLAIRLSYGAFDYYSGGDTTGIRDAD